jgi:DUF1365 family protein
MNSSLYFGNVFHARYFPTRHQFSQRLFMVHLFLDEMETVFQCHPLWSTRGRNVARFDRKDYHGDPEIPLDQSLRETCREQLGFTPDGRISLLTHLRYFGHCFNPVSFYYFWDGDMHHPQVLLAEINNTPWNERYARAFPWGNQENGHSVHQFDKEFHVSPFMPMEIHYSWEFSTPGEGLHVQMVNESTEGKTFEASLDLKRKPIDFYHLSYALARFPFLTLQVIGSIYWHALLLRMKGCTFYPHTQPKPTAITHEC